VKKNFAWLLILLLGSVAFVAPVQGQATPPLKLIQTIPLPGVPGALDHMAIDIKGQRLFVPAEQHHTVTVIDLKTGKKIRTLGEVSWPSTAAYNPHTNELLVTDRADGSIRVFNGATLELTKTIPLIVGADNATYDPATQIFYSVTGGRNAGLPYMLIAIIDTKTKEHIGDIRADSSNVQQMAIEPGTGPKKMYAVFSEKSTIAVIDLERREVVTTWSTMPECQRPYTASLNAALHRLYVGCRMYQTQDKHWLPGRMVVMNTDTGKVVAQYPAGGGSDEMFFDVPSQRIYLQGYEGIADVWKVVDADHCVSLGKIQGGVHGKTSLLVPELQRYYVAVSQHLISVEGVQGGKTEEAYIEVYEVVP
jgi:DNA-binding beta-propeller fold protein YncE